MNRFRQKLPHAPGVYLFKDKTGRIIYVGKAIDLAYRVNSYFHGQFSTKTKLLVNAVADLELIRVESEFTALLFEANLIRQHQPKYNLITKDDKSRLYVVLTLKEELPRVLFLRKTQLGKFVSPKNAIFGPFSSSRTCRQLMNHLRHVVPYCLQRQRNGTPCFYTHLGLCRPCPSQITKSVSCQPLINQYRKQIFRLRDILAGKSTRVIDKMEKEMRQLAQVQKFEEANLIKQQLLTLHQILKQRPAAAEEMTAEGLEAQREKELLALQKTLLPYFDFLSELKRIEAIDISHLYGKFTTGSLVVLTNGLPDTDEYRRFKIKLEKTPNDIASIGEVIQRRFMHPEWPKPDLLVIDGGIGQVKTALNTIPRTDIPMVGLTKRYNEIIVPISSSNREASFKTLRLALTSPALHVLQRIRDEAHRFAISYHKKLRSIGSQITTTR